MKKITRFSLKGITAVAVSSVFAVTSVIVAPLAHADAYLSLSSFSGHPGVTLTVSGGGFNVSDAVKVYLGSVSSSPVSTVTASNDGSISTSVTVPSNTPQGALAVIGVDAHSVQSANSYYVTPFAPTITVNAPSNTAYSNVAVSGAGFAPNETVNLSLAGSTGSATANAAGSFTNASITIPNVVSNVYLLTATGAVSGAQAVNYFFVNSFYASVAPASYYLLPGATLSFNGSGYAAGETVTVYQTNSSVVLSTLTADASGSFTNAGGFTLPNSFAGKTVNFTLTGATSKASAQTSMTVGAFYGYASPSSYYLTPGFDVSFNGGGFGAGESIAVYQVINGSQSATPASTFTTDQNGNFASAGTTTIPFNAAGGVVNYNLVGQSSGASAAVSVGVASFYPSISPSNYFVVPNSTITISGTGFAPNEIVALNINGANGTTTKATAAGSISASLVIPFVHSAGGTVINAVGQTSKASTSVTVTLATFYPSISPSSYYAFPGDMVSFHATGFAQNEQVSYGSSTITANANGAFTTSSTTIPFGNTTGAISYTFTGALSGATVSANIGLGAITPFLDADNYSATPGAVIHVNGHHFAAGETVHVLAGTASTSDIVADSSGTAVATITVPYNSGGNLHVVLTGAKSLAVGSIDIYVQGFSATLGASNYYVLPGTSITLSGTGYAPNEMVKFVASNKGVQSGAAVEAKASALGAVSASFPLPFDTTNSSVTLTATGETSGATANTAVSYAPFSPTVSPSTYYTSPGATISFIGSGFAPNESVAVSFNSASSTSVAASASGAFTYSTVIPYGSKTAHFVFTGSKTNATQSFDIGLAQAYAGIQLSTYYAQGGTALTVSGIGFGAGETVKVTSGSQTLGTATADQTGAFSAAATVPFAHAGSASITATGATSGQTATSPITIAPVYASIQLGGYAGAPGTAVTFIGSGYLPNEPISITTDRTGATEVYTFNAGADGSFSNSSYVVPSSFVEGNLGLTVSGKHSFSTNTITYYVTGGAAQSQQAQAQTQASSTTPDQATTTAATSRQQ